jgi:squalene-hopene/tetraprenyl-beta-curcumene cyclase
MMMNARGFSGWIAAIATVAVLTAGTLASAAEPSSAPAKVDAMAVQRAVDRAAGFLATAQAKDGSFAAYASPGVTSIITTALVRNGRGVNDPVVAKALKYLESLVQPDGGIYKSGNLLENYETCLAMMAFAEANRDGRYSKVLKKAEAFVKGAQWGSAEGADKSDLSYGGAGYGKHKRPDLSNTQFFIEALRAVGDGPNDEAVQKALVFVSRCQNLESPHNTTEFAAKNPDGATAR